MKKTFILSVLTMLSLAAFSLSVSLTDLMIVYDAPDEDINTFLSKKKLQSL